MKKFISFLGIALLASCLLNAQALTDNGGYACGKNAPPVLVEGLSVTVYQTASAENLLTLDTASGEVSSVCDDFNDNLFLNGAPRFPGIEEDVARDFYLCQEYPRA